MPPPGRRRYPPDEIAEALAAIYARADRRLTNLLAGAITRGAGGTARYYEQQRSVIRAEIRKLQRDTARHRGQLMRSAYLTGLSAIDRVLHREKAFTGLHAAAMEVFAANLNEKLRSAEDQIGSTADEFLRRASLEATATGAAAGLTPKQRAKALEDELRQQGLTAFTDRRGRRWTLQAYTSMVARTTTREAMSRGMANRLLDHGRHLIEISQHRTSCPVCKPLEGRTYTLTEEGEPEFDRLDHLPPFHPNCRHVLTPARVSFEQIEKALGLGPKEPEPAEEPAQEGEALTPERSPAQKLADATAELEEGLARLGREIKAPGDLLETGARDRDTKAAVERARGLMNEAFRVPATVPPAHVETNRSITSAADYQPLSKRIRLRTYRTADPDRAEAVHADLSFSLLHEFGHHLDAWWPDKAGFGDATASAAPDSPIGEVLRAIDRSDLMDRIRRNDGLPGAFTPSYRRYLQQRDECFARGFAQWVILRAGSDVDRTALAEAARYAHSWPESDFREIAAAFDTLFERWPIE